MGIITNRAQHQFLKKENPAEADVVNVANMRHLWILDQPFPLTWRRGEAPTP